MLGTTLTELRRHAEKGVCAMILPLLLTLAQVAPPASASQGDVVVIAPRRERELVACLARNCPPAEEVEASLQASVEQFADGRYTDARQTLQRAIHRNKRHAASLPGPVSSLYATLATVAEHDGDTSLWLASARNTVLVLRQHVGTADRATLDEELSFGDQMVMLNMRDSARATYAKVQRLALESGQNQMAAAAAFRQSWLALQARDGREAEKLADQAVALAGPADRTMAQLRDIVRMRIALRRGEQGAVDALAARLRLSATQKPMLLTSPIIPVTNSGRGRGNFLIGHLANLKRDVRFADIGYWIRPDGRTADVEVLRDEGLGQWGSGILKHIRGRRYAPLALGPGDPGLYRIDRFTIRAKFAAETGSRILQRYGSMTVHVVDLTETEAMSATRRDRKDEASSDLPS